MSKNFQRNVTLLTAGIGMALCFSGLKPKAKPELSAPIANTTTSVDRVINSSNTLPIPEQEDTGLVPPTTEQLVAIQTFVESTEAAMGEQSNTMNNFVISGTNIRVEVEQPVCDKDEVNACTYAANVEMGSRKEIDGYLKSLAQYCAGPTPCDVVKPKQVIFSLTSEDLNDLALQVRTEVDRALPL